MWTAIYRLSDGVFLRGAFGDLEFNAGTEGKVLLAGPPDHVRQRYDGTAPSKVRAATQPEIDTAAAADADKRRGMTADQAQIAAVLIFILRHELGRNPTPAERQAARTEYINILQAIS